MGETEQGWTDQAEYDLETARAMLASGRYLYVLFCCQQAVEKALKAMIVARTGALPPRVHNLVRLAEVAKVELGRDRLRFLGELSAYYIQSRYPEEIKAAGSSVSQELADEIMNSAEQTIQWIMSMLR
jgi:HEPN domain-containing protein